jgi:hypothetical protein
MAGCAYTPARDPFCMANAVCAFLRLGADSGMSAEKSWLTSLSWEKVQGINESLCKQHNTGYQANQGFEAARKFWVQAAARQMSLPEVLQVCRRCYDMAPFMFNNGNTFSTIGKNLMEEWLKSLPPLDGQIVRNTVGHYIAGLIEKKELLTVLRHFETSWNAYAQARESVPDLVFEVASNPQQG